MATTASGKGAPAGQADRTAPIDRGPDRRVVDLGPPPGTPERRLGHRRASDLPKPPCPWCGGSTSVVYRSKGAVSSTRYRRRRKCAECVDAAGKARTWPTVERLDTAQFAKELRAEGMTLADLGLEEEGHCGGCARPGRGGHQ